MRGILPQHFDKLAMATQGLSLSQAQPVSYRKIQVHRHGVVINKKRHTYVDFDNTLMSPSENNPRRTLLLVIRHTRQLEELVRSYKANQTMRTFHQARRPIDRLYSIDISAMTQAEYAQFKTLIGV